MTIAENTKTLGEVKKGDTLFCLKYGKNYSLSIVRLTVKDIVPQNIKKRWFGESNIVITEKVPNTPEGKGKFVIEVDEFSKTYTSAYNIYTTIDEAKKMALIEIERYGIKIAEEKMTIAEKENNVIKSIESINNYV